MKKRNKVEILKNNKTNVGQTTLSAQNKPNPGITLIALIIILVILVGVTVRVAINGGLIRNTLLREVIRI